jgi:hypothetical protein
MTTRTTCSACTSPDLEVFLDLGQSPIADAYTTTPHEDIPIYPLQVAVCGKCRLVQLLEVLDGELLFGTGYHFYSSASPPLSAYHATYAAQLLERHEGRAQRGVVEIGCNDGDFLRHFAHLPHLGVDPAAGPALVATDRCLNMAIEPFTLAAAQRIRSQRGPQGLVIANHVLAHAEDVADMLAGIAHLMDDDSIATVEVQYLPDLLVNNAFDLVYHEHRNFFSLTSLEAAANRHGLFALDAEQTDRQGGSLRVTLGQANLLPWRQVGVEQLRVSEWWLASFGAYEGMQGRAERIRTRLREMLGQLNLVAVYGAPAKVTTLLNFCGLTSAELAWCVDSTPAKQGRYIPGTDIRIVAPNDPFLHKPDAYLLAAWNYAATIMANNPGNRWLLAIPAPVLL